ncbi:MAG: class 1 fructose-bisphosphatase [Epsilonproteobacteria bacterium]|nr:class 1 fructose-bisphosphatase [Campylobacterota bacterium]
MNRFLEAMKRVAIEIEIAIKSEDLGYLDSSNSSGEEQLKLDVKSDKIIEDELSKLSDIKAVVSEEKDSILELNGQGRYIVCYDPLDGSSLIDANLSVGTIFGIYDGELRGESIIASGYIVYGPRLELVFTTREGRPQLYRLIGDEFKYIKSLTLNERGKLNSSGATQRYWKPHHKRLIEELFQEGYRLRYSGGMVPDLHHILIKGGGLFSYPATSDNINGKLRQLFEVIPFALIFERANGEAIDENCYRLLELTPEDIHDRSSCFFGSKYEIDRVRVAYGR